ncbi:hypothetical protein D3P09_12355 [Paenibacillus pinisoli]|uniref:YmaF family protein n=1 Tax=Paenibacillus pinisoli TaxID=1276110 RepID=A0A3A6PLE1_9BACL|nr:YmaF family protein [Paenibacillus pinisoli]RJX40148.1 hypothetical protein D3P09_12355 [Paenibacillus pinisoli]
MCIWNSNYGFIVSKDKESVHSQPAPSGGQHVHHYYAKTSFDDEHIHYIRGTTGPSIALLNGGRYHYFEGQTTMNGRYPHSHMYRGNTGNEIMNM